MKILALDIGDAWIGSALTDPLCFFAKPYQTIAAQDLNKFLTQLFAKESISTIVIGMPITLKGTHSDQTKRTLTQKEILCAQFPDKKWVLWDERLTSKQASKIKSAQTKEEKLHQHSI